MLGSFPSTLPFVYTKSLGLSTSAQYRTVTWLSFPVTIGRTLAYSFLALKNQLLMGRNEHLTSFTYLNFSYPTEAQKVIFSGEKQTRSANTFLDSCDIDFFFVFIGLDPQHAISYLNCSVSGFFIIAFHNQSFSFNLQLIL